MAGEWRVPILALLGSLAGSATAAQPLPAPACAELATLLVGAAAESGPVCRVNITRADLRVMLLGTSLPAGAGLGSWAAFLPDGPVSLVMGDLATESADLPRVIRALVEAGFDIMAVHRHMLGESPAMSFVHYSAKGEPRDLARRLRQSIGPPLRAGVTPIADALVGQPGVVTGIPCAAVSDALGGDSVDAGPGFCRVNVAHDDRAVTIGGLALPVAMGLSSWAAFRETADRTAVVLTGDLALEATRAATAVATLVRGGIDVVSVHNHLTGETPALTFVHFQARGNALLLAGILRSALDAR